jgi:MFS family permease
MSQTNAIALGAILGQYGSALFMGAFADKSARLSSLLAGVLFVSGFTMMAFSLSSSTPPSYAFFVGFFVLAGSGTVAAYFGALTASAKSFPDHPGLAIGVPSALFGISPLLLSTIGSALFTVKEGKDAGDIDAVALFAFLAGLTGVVNLFSACFLKPIIVRESEEKIVIEESSQIIASESQPLLPTIYAHPPHQSLLPFMRQSSVWIFVAIVLLIK